MKAIAVNRTGEAGRPHLDGSDNDSIHLRTDIAEYERLLGSEDRRRKLVLKELGELVDTHGQDRRAEIINADDIPVFETPKESDASFDADTDEPCVVTLSTSGNLGRVPTEGAKKGVAGRHDLVASALVTSTGTAIAGAISAGSRCCRGSAAISAR